MNASKIFRLNSSEEFNSLTLDIFNYQLKENSVYREFCNHLGVEKDHVQVIEDIPFLPVELFKTRLVLSGERTPEVIFTSSGTTGITPSKHALLDSSVYQKSYLYGFEYFYGSIKDYCVIGLLPSYLEQKNSSLIYMVQDLILKSGNPQSAFHMHDMEALSRKLVLLEKDGVKILLLGVSFALLEMAEKFPLQLKNTIIMETGGMKGRRKEMIREELHDALKKGFGVPHIHSEYGMTELLSQAYSKGNGLFKPPPWMSVLTRNPYNPLKHQKKGKNGGINVIDLANIHSCSFIATQDLGRIYPDGSFEVLGRFDNADIRGCNLMAL